MSLHVFANIVTSYGAAANNRGEKEGNTTTLQKLVWFGQAHTTVSAEAIRFALRRIIAEKSQDGTNRRWSEGDRMNLWEDPEFKGWKKKTGTVYPDDDLLGYMLAEPAKEEGEAGSCNARRAVLEVTRAVSLTPWAGDMTFNAASPGATLSAQKKGSNPVLYGTEVHATRYQFGLALTPQRLRNQVNAIMALQALRDLATVAGNHGRFLFDFSPDAVVLRLTDDPAPRLLYCFQTGDEGRSVDAPVLAARVRDGDIKGEELVIGGNFPAVTELKKLGAKVFPGVKAAFEEAVVRMAKAMAEGMTMTGVYVTIPVACFRKGQARELFETESIPPPATCYGFLLSLVGETDRHAHLGARVAPMLLSSGPPSVVIRTLWRIKNANARPAAGGIADMPAKARKEIGSNFRPDYQQILTNVELVIWLSSAEETSPPGAGNLELRVHTALDPKRRGAITRFGGLCLGESTHLVDVVRLVRHDPRRKGTAFLLADKGRFTFPVWVDHVGSAGTRYATGDLVESPLLDPPAERLPRIVPH